MTAAYLGWSATATDTTELNMSAARFAAAETAFIPLAVTFAAPPEPRPEPPPQRLPRRLRRRAASHLALLATSAAGFAAALTASGAW
jgi:hypothetical protein